VDKASKSMFGCSWLPFEKDVTFAMSGVANSIAQLLDGIAAAGKV